MLIIEKEKSWFFLEWRKFFDSLFMILITLKLNMLTVVKIWPKSSNGYELLKSLLTIQHYP